MKTTLGHSWLVVGVALGVLTTGCTGGGDDASGAPGSKNPEKEIKASKESIPAPPAPTPPQRATDRKPNPNGKVFVVEYHHIDTGKGEMYRSPEEFKGDLERLYKLGFRPCTVSQYLDDKMEMPPGATPAVFTFDDSNPSQLQMNEDGTVKPDCAVGIWMEFAKTHPDFPVRATFYVLPVMFGQPKLREKKLALLRELGCELGNHTVNHLKLKRLSDEKVKQELAVATDDLEKMGEKLPVSIALPYGMSPKNRALLKGFDYKGKKYTFKAVFLVGSNPAPAPTDPKLDRFRIPRIQAYNGELSLTKWLDQYEKGHVKVYVAP